MAIPGYSLASIRDFWERINIKKTRLPTGGSVPTWFSESDPPKGTWFAEKIKCLE